MLAGRAQADESGYRKSAVLQIYLLGFLEFPETLMIFTPKTLFALTSGKKCTSSARMASWNERNADDCVSVIDRLDA